MPRHVPVCMLDGQFTSVDLDRCTPYPSRQKGVILPDGGIACDLEAFATVGELEERLAGERTAPLWYCGRLPRTGDLLLCGEAGIWAVEVSRGALIDRRPDHVQLTEAEALAWLKANRYRAPAVERQADVPEVLTLDQAAALVHRSKRTLERHKTKGKLPAPIWEGGGGRADYYAWETLRPWLMETFGQPLPERVPGVRTS